MSTRTVLALMAAALMACSSSVGPNCTALNKCCTLLASTPSAEGASCNGQVPTSEAACGEALDLFQASGSCLDIQRASNDAGYSFGDAGGPTSTSTGTGTGFGSSSSSEQLFACYALSPSGVSCVQTNEISCSSNSEQPGTCPSDGLVGCCIQSGTSGAAFCEYAGYTTDAGAADAGAMTGQMGCTAAGGTWMTAVPTPPSQDAGGPDGGSLGFTCNAATTSGLCESFTNVYDAFDVSQFEATCTKTPMMGTVEPPSTCPTANLLGCCTSSSVVADEEHCLYSNGQETLSSFMADCSAVYNGTFSTTP